MTQSSQAKGKKTMSVELSGEAPPKTRKNAANNQESKFSNNTSPSFQIILLQR